MRGVETETCPACPCAEAGLPDVVMSVLALRVCCDWFVPDFALPSVSIYLFYFLADLSGLMSDHSALLCSAGKKIFYYYY